MLNLKNNPDEAPPLENILAQVMEDEKRFPSEKRSEHRDLLFVPVQVRQDKLDFSLSGYTRDISSRGICLIMPQPYRTGTVATIQLSGSNTQETSAAQCHWSSKFGSAYWASGWSLSETWQVGRLLKEDRFVEPDQRNTDRWRAALPVNICIPGQKFHVSGFSRNLSRGGICLMSKVATTPGQIADLEIKRVNGESYCIESHCAWAKQYDEETWVSGWKFNTEEISAS